jgi:glucosamine-6-phosphate deaminase
MHSAPPKERIPLRVFHDPAEASRHVAAEIATLIRIRQREGRRTVLGLATGSSPMTVYEELIRLHREEGLSFKGVTTFNLDEYVPMDPGALQSYRRFMQEHLFDHVDMDPAEIHIPDGTLPVGEIPAACEAFEEAIHAVGGIDLQLLGIGRTGHVGFNEPGSGGDSRTRLIWLDRLTRLDAASDFFGEENVPRRAITMGVGTILEARRIILLAWGEGKAPIVARMVEGEPSPQVPATFLQHHPQVEVVLDDAAAAELTRAAAPWLTGEVSWTPARVRQAVIWLARRTEKGILKLTDEDYNEHGLQALVATHGPAYRINLEIFRLMQGTVNGWPGGKPPGERRPGDIPRERDDLHPKRILIFSPHPDDDVISMGGTLIRLVEQGHEVHVAYQVSGSIAVFDEDVLRFTEVASAFNRSFGIDPEAAERVEARIRGLLANKRPGDVDAPEIQRLKALIRRGEAVSAARLCGIPSTHLHFLDLPFYETGLVRKRPLGEEDHRIMTELLRALRPHQIYAAGDLSDPHGTHRVCLAAVGEACRRVSHEAWTATLECWLYRGAWQEWPPEEIDMAVPLSPDELRRKRAAIFRHESQKDRALFPGIDDREFWQRAEDRNRGTARLYDALGLAEYEAMEGFVRWDPMAGTVPQAGV